MPIHAGDLLTAAQEEREAAEAEMDAARARYQARLARARALEVAAKQLQGTDDVAARPAPRPLRTVRGTGTIRGVTEGQLQAMRSKSIAAKGHLHPLQRALSARSEYPQTVPELAAALRKAGEDVAVDSARSWCKVSPLGRRRTPERIARRIEAMIGLAATEENYPNGIRRLRSD